MSYISTHFRVVSALIVREMSTRFGGKPGGYIWALLEPAAYIGMMTVIFSAIAHTPALGTSFSLFFATGFIAFQFYQGTAIYLNSAVRANKGLLSYPNVAPIDTIVARLILQIGTTTIVSAIVFLGILSTIHFSTTINWPDLMEAVFLAGVLALGVSLANCVLFTKSALYEQVFNIVTRPLLLLSGVMYLPDSLPYPYRDFLLLNPICHITMLFRTGFYPQYRAIGLDISYLCWSAAVVFFFGLLVFTLAGKTIRGD